MTAYRGLPLPLNGKREILTHTMGMLKKISEIIKCMYNVLKERRKLKTSC